MTSWSDFLFVTTMVLLIIGFLVFFIADVWNDNTADNLCKEYGFDKGYMTGVFAGGKVLCLEAPVYINLETYLANK
jgi:hypothetical protein